MHSAFRGNDLDEGEPLQEGAAPQEPLDAVVPEAHRANPYGRDGGK